MESTIPNTYKAIPLDIPEPFLRFVIADRDDCLDDNGSGVITLYDDHDPEHFTKIDNGMNSLVMKYTHRLSKLGLFPNFSIGHAGLWSMEFSKKHGSSLDIAVFNQADNIQMQREVFKWLAHGERDDTSQSVALTTLGHDLSHRVINTPKDVAVLRRLILLVRQAPSTYSGGMVRLAKQERERVSMDWTQLLSAWPQLKASLATETGYELDPDTSAPDTQALLASAAYN